MKNLVFICLIFIFCPVALALPGDLDTTFGVSGGYLISDFAGAQIDERHGDSAIQADGKIVVVGKRFQGVTGFDEYLVARFNPDGTLDNTFSGDGFFTLFDNSQFESANAVAIQPDGKIVVVGGEGGTATEAFVFRLNTDGTLDTTFSGDGIQVIVNSGNGLAVVIQPSDSKIVIGTSSIGNNLPTVNQTVIIRLNTDGSLDSTFDGDGRAFVNPRIYLPNGLALQTDEKIILAGQHSPSTVHDVAVVRLSTNGALDNSFDGDGVVRTTIPTGSGEARCVTVQSDGKIVIGGGAELTIGYDPLLIRYSSDGTLDAGFDGDGIKNIQLVANNESYYINDIVQQTDGKIVGISDRSGTFSFSIPDDFFLVRVDTDGSIDNSFDANGVVKSPWCENGTDLSLQTDGKIVALGSLDRSDSTTSVHGICVQRYNTDGSFDTSLNLASPNGKAILSMYGFTSVEAIAGLPTGKIMVAGWGEGTLAGINVAKLIRLNANGTLDTTFMNEGVYERSNSTTSTYFYDLHVMNDGSFFVAGDFAINGAMLVKFTSAGVPDTTFSGDGLAFTANAARFHAVTVQPDGKVIGCGSSGSATRNGRIARFSATGVFEAFAANTLGASGNNSEIFECGLQTDGKIVVAGYGFDGVSDSVRVSRHLSTLSVDTTFGTSGVVTTDMSTTLDDRATDMVVQTNDRIVVSSTGIGTNGDRDFAVIRYEPNGALDLNFTENFGNNGISLIPFGLTDPNDEANALLLEPPGTIVVGGLSTNAAGNRFAVAKLNPNGNLRSGFATFGRLISAFPNNDARINALAFQFDGKILAGGRTWNGSDYDFAIARYENELAPTAASVTVSGRVLTASGNGIRNVLVSITDSDGNTSTTVTGSFGYYRFNEIPAGGTHVVSVNSKRFAFSQPVRVIVAKDEVTDLDFIADE